MEKINLILPQHYDRRTNVEETWQKDRLKSMLKHIAKEQNLALNLRDWDKSGYANAKSSVIITEEGNVLKRMERCDKKSKSKGRDSKAFDANAYLSDGNKDLSIHFFLKYTKERGGIQDSIMFEVVKTTDNISKNKNDNQLFFFLMEGDRWDSDEQLKNDRGFDNQKAVLLPTNSNNEEIQDILNNYIFKFFNNYDQI